MLASGFAGLGSQIAWTQQAAHWLGHDGLAVLAVVGAFFGGLALGALALGERIQRSADPGRWYAGCELMIALWSAVLVLDLAPACRALMLVLGPQAAGPVHALVALAGVFLLLLPATAAMGATLPAMQRLVAEGGPHKGRPEAAIGWLYAANTAGAVLGVLAAAFWLVPAVGLTRTAALCALLNAACALGVLAWRRQAVATPAPAAVATGAAPRRWWLPLAATGALGIGFELLVVRVLRQVAENTVYTFALLLAVYLVATAIGAALWQRAQGRHAPAADADAPLLLALATACALGGASLWQAVAIKTAVLAALGPLLGPSMAAALAAEAVLAALAFGLPAACMGAVFSQLCSRARAAGIGLGRSLGINTLGAAAAPLLVGVALLPAAGAKATLLALVAGYLLLLPWRGATRWPGTALAGMLVAAALWAPPLRIVDLPEGARLVQYREGAQAAVSIVEDAQGVARLHIDNRQQEGSSHTVLADGRQALLPLLLHPAPRRALFLGLGTGITAATAAGDTQLQVDAVELLPEVIAASAHFTGALHDGRPNPRLHLLQADARRYVRASGARYDLIVADNFHPARSGSAALYTVEHFRAVGARLAPGGVFCQWLPLHQLDLDSLRAIVAAFLAAHPQAQALLATNSLDTPTLGLVARADGQAFDAVALRRRLVEAAITPPPAAFGLPDDLAVLGSFIAGPQALAAFAGDAAANTDDRPVVAHLAPRITYAPDSTPRQRLVALLSEFRRQPLRPADLISQAPAPGWNDRLAAYWQARDAFLAAGMAVRPAADVRQMLAQVQQPLLAVLRTSADFRPAYDPLLRMAGALAASDPGAARGLLVDLQRLQPARPEAAQALQTLPAP